jgi:hypothetical protein
MYIYAVFLHPMRGGHRRKSTNDREGSKFRNYDVASGTILSTCKSFHAANKLFDQVPYKILKPAAHNH